MTPPPWTTGLGETIGPLHTFSVFHSNPGGSVGVTHVEAEPVEAGPDPGTVPVAKVPPPEAEYE